MQSVQRLHRHFKCCIYSREQRAKYPCLHVYLATAARVKYPAACSEVFDFRCCPLPAAGYLNSQRGLFVDDKKWIREIHQGNNEPLGQIAEKYYDDIYRFCCYQTGNPADACDCAQETFIRFIRYVDSYRERNLKGYLLTIAANVCRDYFKKLYRDRELEQAQLARPAGQERDFTENCGQSSLLQALSRLPGAQREALTLYYFDELKIREIARITGTNTATVKSRLHQGKQKLKKILEEESQ